MTKPWEAERVVDPELARRLIRAQAPGISAERVELLGAGWDNTVYRVDGEWVFRFPRREIGARLIAIELAILPRIAGRLPAPIPNPVWAGEPTPDFPWPFAGYRYLPGEPASHLDLGDEGRAALAEPLGRFLAALHALPIEELVPLGLPRDTLGRLDLDRRIPQAQEQLDRALHLGLISSLEPYLPLMEGLPRGPRPTCLVHGDFYARHLLLCDRRLCGVIDWGDLHAGDPAVDLMVLAAFLPACARPAFLASYGPIEDETLRLARFRALYHTLALLLYAHDLGDAPLLREARRALGYLS